MMSARLMRWWYEFLRLWEVIDLDAARKVDNWEAATDCRLRIAELDRKIDGLSVG